MNIDIAKESNNYLEVQIYGCRGDKSLERFNRIALSQNEIEVLQILQNTFYYGDQSGAIERLNKSFVKETLYKLERNCSSIEKTLIYLFLMLVDCNSDIDISKYDDLEKTYNAMFEAQ
ncbi:MULTISPECIES: hypothetical protein [unclassified Francisella]|uniref:hypothetical protein n=1 Tax=unclassified Francisella TaxID=2610885 RepID=UPI002E3111A9|nr:MULTISPECIES: hypothetical protein [unclassified Francisella]MED7818915.1 hypothetical protein [Francisella sp. 19S2-4]MED7829752.1 hypothetical protein [Francisella sp. 19S2-10]